MTEVEDGIKVPLGEGKPTDVPVSDSHYVLSHNFSLSHLLVMIAMDRERICGTMRYVAPSLVGIDALLHYRCPSLLLSSSSMTQRRSGCAMW